LKEAKVPSTHVDSLRVSVCIVTWISSASATVTTYDDDIFFNILILKGYKYYGTKILKVPISQKSISTGKYK
jgi:hypothetical protein